MAAAWWTANAIPPPPHDGSGRAPHLDNSTPSTSTPPAHASPPPTRHCQSQGPHDWFMPGSVRRDGHGRCPRDPFYDPATLLIPAAALRTMTPFERQFWELKREAMDVVLLVRCGSFYNILGPDVPAALGVGLNPTRAAGGFEKKCGFSATKAAFRHWAERFIAAGHVIGRVEEEIPGPANAKRQGSALRGRKLVQIISPGTKASDELLESHVGHDAPSSLIAISTSRNGRSVGVAVADLCRGTLKIGDLHGCDAARTQLSLALNHIYPAEIIHDISVDKDALAVTRQYAATTSTRAQHHRVAVRRRATLPDEALRSVLAHLRASCRGKRCEGILPRDEDDSKRHIVAATALVVKHLDDAGLSAWVHNVGEVCEYALHSPGAGIGVMPIDAATIQQLSLFAGSEMCAEGSLCNLLDRTSTRAGARLLREWLAAPLNTLEAILSRQAAIRALHRTQGLCASIRHALSHATADVESRLTRAGMHLSEWLARGDLDANHAMLLHTEPLGCAPASAAAGGKPTPEHANGDDVYMTHLENTLRTVVCHLGVLVDAAALLSATHSRIVVENNDALASMVGDVARAAAALRPLQAVLDAMQSLGDIDDASLEANGRVGALLCNLKWVERRRSSAIDVLHNVLDVARSECVQENVEVEFCNQSANDFSVLVRCKDPTFEPPASWIALGSATGSVEAKSRNRKRQFTRKFRIPQVEQLSDAIVDLDVEQRAASVDIVRMLSADFVRLMPTWRLLISRCAELDVFVSILESTETLAKQTRLPMCFPSFLDDRRAVNSLHLRGAWNPTLGACSSSRAILPESKAQANAQHVKHPQNIIQNDVDMEEGGCCVLLTGPNMSGKSTILRLCGICVVMAQIGAPVPAEEMRLGVVDRIFSRIGSDDCIEAGESTFMMEMNQTSFFLRNASRSSLVLVDELGRGTSTFDGLAIAYAVLVHLTHRTRCRTLFSTHYHKLVEDFTDVDDDVRVVIAHMECDLNETALDISPSFRLRMGASQLGSCGLLLARKCGLDRALIDRANAKSSVLGAIVAANIGRQRIAAQCNRIGRLHEDEMEWICDMADDLVLTRCVDPDDAFHDDFRSFWQFVRQRYRSRN